MQLSLYAVSTYWEDYEVYYIETLKKLKLKYNFEVAVFDVIDLQALKD
jgi:hypothetical protein